MVIDQLLKMYPSAKVISVPNWKDKTIVNYRIVDQWISIEKNELDSQQIELLELLSDHNEDETTNHWWQFLNLRSSNIPLVSKKIVKIKVIQFHTTKLESRDLAQQWIRAFSSFFNKVIDTFWVTSEYGILILSDSEIALDNTELISMIQLVDEDFGTKTEAYVGQSWNLNEELPEIFELEKCIFEQNDGDAVSNLSSDVISFMFNQKLASEKLFIVLKNTITSNSEYIAMIRSLYSNQNNIAKTAKDLYVHRNTLLYRIDKFNRETGLNLKSMDDLVLCHLLLC
ncbi:helix-turn-helix domain-containing protein [Companilactobacillus jidongensis]|uniref:helix-turn-helix domain-containing protein n=1 Tax=Companilactobacillus jidongensis TaxID=2486006 RepID=UPI000F78563B|nr:helix-turn-helix domain-containing protein [Companilactobacillus jidongensis]